MFLWFFAWLSPAAEAGEVRVEGRTFMLRDGFEIERVAGPPLVDRPIEADFDEKGRLYVSDSSGSNAPPKQQLVERTHRIVRLEDVDGDGRYDRRTVFADRMMFPEGVLWADGSLYVAAPPSIWKLTDTDDDGVADRREEWFQGKTLNGCANDLHGPYPGPDGWVYWCKGAFELQTYERPDGPPFVTKASHIFRRRLDGRGIVEPVMTGGMDNPVGVAFTPGGERIFTTTFFQHPGGGRRDGLIHAVYGGVYGKVHAVIDGHTRTGPDVMPVLTHLGPAAPCGLACYESGSFGDEFRGNLFAAQFNMQKISRHILETTGATFTTRDEDFLVGKDQDRDFHPTDVFEDADGSLLVIDTGGWYKLCCPSSQLVKADVLGAIYRIRRSGAPKVVDPRGLKLAWSGMSAEELVPLLGDPRPAVRRRAMNVLGKKGLDAVPALAEAVRSGPSAEARKNAVWAATRIDHADARAVAQAGLGDADETVRQASSHSASVRVDRAASSKLITLLGSSSPHDRRVAAEALGRLGDKSAVPALLDAAAAPNDRVLEHSLTYALIEIDAPEATRAGLTRGEAGTRRAALIALDQMKGGGLDPDAVAPLLASSVPALKETASWIAGRHPEWGGALAGFLRGRLEKAGDLSEAERAELRDQLARLAPSVAVQGLLADRVRRASASREERSIALQAMARAGLKSVPGSWADALAHVLAGDDAESVRLAAATVRALPTPKEGVEGLRAALLRVGRSATAPEDVRLEALAVVPGGLPETAPEVFAFLLERLRPDRSTATRVLAADVLAGATLGHDQLLSLADAVRAAGPLEVNRLLPAFGRTTDVEVGRKLVDVLKGAGARSSLRVDALKKLLAKFPPEVHAQAEPLYASLAADAAGQTAKLEGLLATVKPGDIRRGQAVFNGTKAACSTCHAIGYLGGKVGPDLTRIGQIRSERDLFEAIIAPSASFVQTFEPVVVATTNGQVLNGLLRKDAPDEVVLATGADAETRIPRSDIDEMRPSTVSLMPAGLDQQLSPEELADLVAFLKACK